MRNTTVEETAIINPSFVTHLRNVGDVTVSAYRGTGIVMPGSYQTVIACYDSPAPYHCGPVWTMCLSEPRFGGFVENLTLKRFIFTQEGEELYRLANIRNKVEFNEKVVPLIESMQESLERSVMRTLGRSLLFYHKKPKRNIVTAWPHRPVNQPPTIVLIANVSIVKLL